jgi:hypothetical protein
VPAREIGEVGGSELAIDFDGGRLAVPVETLHHTWSTALGRALDL